MTRRRQRRLARVLVATWWCAALLAACGDDGEADEVSDDSIATGDNPLAAAVRIEAFGCHTTATVGGGSFVGPERVLTVAHVVAGAEHIEVELADGRMAEAQLIAIDRGLDLAVLHVEVEVSPLPIGTATAGSTGVFVTYRDGPAATEAFRIERAQQLQLPDFDGGGEVRRQGFELSAEVLEGDSGSILVHDGKAVGVVFARSSRHGERAWATDIHVAATLLAADDDSTVDTGECVADPR